jgi:hypothetical protein
MRHAMLGRMSTAAIGDTPKPQPPTIRLYFDETGDHYYATDATDVGKRYLGLIGVSFERDAYLTFQGALEGFKRKHLHYDPDFPPVLHRKDIVNASGSFYRLQDAGKRAAFDTDLLGLIAATEFRLVGVVIDKHTHAQKTYRALRHPYHYCLQALLERYCGWLSFSGKRGDVMAEARGKAENQALETAYDVVWRTGTSYHGYDLFQRTLTSKKVKIKKKGDNIAGLQLADVLAHAVTREVLIAYARTFSPPVGFAADLGKVIEPKYNRQVYSGRIMGYGRVLLD